VWRTWDNTPVEVPEGRRAAVKECADGRRAMMSSFPQGVGPLCRIDLSVYSSSSSRSSVAKAIRALGSLIDGEIVIDVKIYPLVSLFQFYLDWEFIRDGPRRFLKKL
jgi:hypothetical protein